MRDWINDAPQPETFAGWDGAFETLFEPEAIPEFTLERGFDFEITLEPGAMPDPVPDHAPDPLRLVPRPEALSPLDWLIRAARRRDLAGPILIDGFDPKTDVLAVTLPADSPAPIIGFRSAPDSQGDGIATDLLLDGVLYARLRGVATLTEDALSIVYL